MQKILAVLLLSLTGLVWADPTVTLDYDQKSKQNVSAKETHNVYGISINSLLNKNFTVGIKLEDEYVIEKNRTEGLIQLQSSYSPGRYGGFRPSITVAIGEKFKSQEFPFYVLGGAVKYNFTDDLAVIVASRLRAPFDSQNHYRTVENSVGISYNMTKNFSVGARYKMERGDSDYNTYNVNFNYRF